ncbi:hypothetical protein D3C83_100210 [compost metagenome]
MDIGGWDTHANQPGQLNQRLREYGEGLSAFYRDLGNSSTDGKLIASDGTKTNDITKTMRSSTTIAYLGTTSAKITGGSTGP